VTTMTVPPPASINIPRSIMSGRGGGGGSGLGGSGNGAREARGDTRNTQNQESYLIVGI